MANSNANFEFNKIFAAVLLAGITAMVSYFIATKLVHPEKLKKDAVEIEGGPVEIAAAGEPMPEPILHLIATADVARGEKLSRACAACHSFDEGGVNKIGPNLYNTVMSKKGFKDGFAYSDALIEKGGVWSYYNLNYFLWKPKAYAPGTKMNYIGLRKPQDRADIIAWMRTLASSPAALPSEADIQAELEELGLVQDEEAEVEGEEDAEGEEVVAGEVSEEIEEKTEEASESLTETDAEDPASEEAKDVEAP